jgi:ABC-type lipoprotein release transport system permease subunit
MVDFLFALGQFICLIGLLYGVILAVLNHKYVGATESRYDPVTGHEWHREEADHALQLLIVPEPPVAMNMSSGLRPLETLNARVLEDQRLQKP